MPTYSFTIDSTERRVQRIDIRASVNGPATLTCDVISLDGSFRPQPGDEIVLTRDSNPMFAGVIEGPVRERGLGAGAYGSAAAIVVSVQAVDFTTFIGRRVLNITIPPGTLKAALEALVPYLDRYGVTLDAGQPGGPSLPAVDLPFQSLASAFDYLEKLSGWVREIDANKILRMVEPADHPAPFDVEPGDRVVEGDVIVEDPDPGQFANRILLLAGEGAHEVTDTFTGDGSTAAYALRYSLISHRGYVETNGVFETLGTSGATWTLSGNTITRSTNVPNGHAVVIHYVAQFPVLVSAEDVPTPDALVERLFANRDVFDVDLAQALADAALARHNRRPRTVRYRTRQFGLRPGMVQHLEVPLRNLNGEFIVQEVHTYQITDVAFQHEIVLLEGVIPQTPTRDFWRVVTHGAAPQTVVGYLADGAQSGVTGRVRWGRVGDSAGTDTAVGIGIDINNGLTGGSSSRWALVADYGPGGVPNQGLVILDRSDGDVTKPLMLWHDGEYHLSPSGTTNVLHPVTLGDTFQSFGGGRFSNAYLQDCDALLGYFERGRTVRMGDWTAVAHSAGNFTGSGSMTWTVAAGDQASFAYTLLGKTLTVSFSLVNTSVGGTPSTDLRIAIPGSFTAARQMGGGGLDISDNGTRMNGTWAVTASGSHILCRRPDLGNWAASTDNTIVQGAVSFEVA